MKPYSIRTLRLVGFHNFEDETIPITGDLFVLGVNESGKTTILDAIQLALSGGQDFEWNAAARVDGRRDGRSLQGVILRADIAGVARRQGMSIAYAALELSTESGSPRTLVFGASAADMNEAPTVWGVIVEKPASELPLTRPNPDGSAAVLGPDDLEIALGQKISRGVGYYRTRVAEALFGDRAEYARITKLWQTAKSYRELARAARHMNELFLQVLPAPDPEPFLKVRKAFADIQKLRVDMDDLRKEIGLLTSLQAALEQARESREALRRYEYVRTRNALGLAKVSLEGLRQEITQAEADAATFDAHASEAKDQARTLTAEIELLRATPGFVISEQITKHEAHISEEQVRLEQARGALNFAESTLAQSRSDHSDARAAAENGIRAVRVACENWKSQASLSCPEILPSLDGVLRSLPSGLGSPFDAAVLSNAVKAAQLTADDAAERIEQERDRAALDVKECRDSASKLAEEHRRIAEAGDLLPDQVEVLDALAELGRRGIPATLLYQHIEFTDDAPASVRSVIEEVLRKDTLFTVVVAPEATSAARDAVLAYGTGVKVLDALSVSGSGARDAPRSLCSFVRIAEHRVRSHVEAVFSEAGLLEAPPPEGDPRMWFIDDGDVGDAATRRRTGATKPQWIGADSRAERRERRLAQLRAGMTALAAKESSVAGVIERCESTAQFLRKFNRECPGVANTELLDTRWKAVAVAVSRESQDTLHVKSARSNVQRHRDHLERYRRELRSLKQREGADAVKARKQFERLEQRRAKVEERREEMIKKAGEANGRRKIASDGIRAQQSRVAEAEAAGTAALVALSSLPGMSEISDIDQYVFQKKQGHLIKDPEQKINEAREQLAAVLERLKGTDGVLNPVLASRFGFGVRDTGDLIDITDRTGRALQSLVLERQQQELDVGRTIDERTSTLFEQVLATELVARLREYRRSLEGTINGLNKVLAELRFGDSIFRVHLSPLAESKPLLELLKAQSVIDDANRRRLMEFLANREDLFETEGEVPQFLDYRHWYEFSIERREVAGEGAVVMGAEAMVRGSGGAQSTHAYLLLFALASLLFDRAGARIRVLMMDEAFPNLDVVRKELLLRCAKHLRLDLAIATPDLDGTILGPSLSHTTVLIERDEQHRVAVTPLAFSAAPDQAELFEAPRPRAFVGVEEASRP